MSRLGKLFVCIGCLLFQSQLFAQQADLNKYITYVSTNQTFDKILEGFEQKTGMFFQYDPSIVPEQKIFSVQYRNVRARQAIEDFLNQSGLTFIEKDGMLILKKSAAEVQVRRYIISGRVTFVESGEFLGSATIANINSTARVFSSDAGYFTLALSPGINIIKVSYPGFESLFDTITGDRDYFVNYSLKLVGETLPQAVIKGKKNDENISVVDGQSDKHNVTRIKSKHLPYLLGESDIVRVMSLYPGVVSGSEGMLGMYIRGGASDQNLVLLDGVPVFNSYHLYGIFSIFNDEIVKSATLQKGSFPARYGGRLSSVVDVQSKEGNIYNIKGSFNVGLLSSRLFFEGPLIKNRTTFTVSFRRSYVDFLAAPAAKLFLSNDSLRDNVYYFWDLNARVSHRFSSRSRLAISFYTGRDVAGIDEKQTTEPAGLLVTERRRQISSWGNLMGSVNWNMYLGKKTTMVVKGHITEYNYRFSQSYRLKKKYTATPELNINDYTEYKLLNGIRDAEASVTFQHAVSNKVQLTSGVGLTSHKFIPGNRSLSSDIDSVQTEIVYNDDAVNTPEGFGFFEVNALIGKRFYADLGIRTSVFQLDKNVYYLYGEPRGSVRYKAKKGYWFKLGAMRTRQFFHLLTNLTLGLPSDLWVPSNEKYRPAFANQFSGGFSKEGKVWQFSSEVFYKTLGNILEYKSDASYITSASNWQDAFTSGKGEAYGWECMAEKTKGALTGWASYTLMYNNRIFPELNNGTAFPARYDRRHNVSLAAIYNFSKNIVFSASWVYISGFAITTPIGKYLSGTPTDPYREIFIYGDRNNTRTRDNHRLDIAVTFEKQKKIFTRTWTVGIFNVYNRRNPFYVNLGFDQNGGRTLSQVSLLPIMPNISYKLSF